jgi:hypothetical protein
MPRVIRAVLEKSWNGRSFSPRARGNHSAWGRTAIGFAGAEGFESARTRRRNTCKDEEDSEMQPFMSAMMARERAANLLSEAELQRMARGIRSKDGRRKRKEEGSWLSSRPAEARARAQN